MVERITVKEAAQMMGISCQAVRILMQRKEVNIGFVVGKGKKRYLIYRERVEESVKGI